MTIDLAKKWLTIADEKEIELAKSFIVKSLVGLGKWKEAYESVKKGELAFLIGSVRTIEIAAREDSASKRLKAGVGDEVRIE